MVTLAAAGVNRTKREQTTLIQPTEAGGAGGNKAPIPAVRATAIEPPSSTHCRPTRPRQRLGRGADIRTADATYYSETPCRQSIARDRRRSRTPQVRIGISRLRFFLSAEGYL
jgi:hypothetical protein